MRKLLPVPLAKSCYFLLCVMVYTPYRENPLDCVLNKCLLFKYNDCFNYCSRVEKNTGAMCTELIPKHLFYLHILEHKKLLMPVRFVKCMSICFQMAHAGPST